MSFFDIFQKIKRAEGSGKTDKRGLFACGLPNALSSILGKIEEHPAVADRAAHEAARRPKAPPPGPLL
jgi:hypothetical protein